MLKSLQKIKPLWIVLCFIWRKTASQKWFAPFILAYIKLRVFQFASSSPQNKDKTKLTLLATNHKRFQADLCALSENENVSILVLPHDVQALINSIFLNDIDSKLDGLNNVEISLAYRDGTVPEIKEKQEKLEKYLSFLIPRIQESLKIDAFVSCSFFYIVDLSWQIACNQTNVPFFVLHKESLQDPVIIKQNTKRFMSMGMKYYGQKIFVYNHLAKKLLIEADICDEDKIVVTGACRMDPLIKKIKNGQIKQPKKKLTLFSFHHSIGRVMLKNHTNYFSHDPNDGFVKYFDTVHSQIINFAYKHPDIDVFIKPKWGGLWIDKIEDIAVRETGKKSEDIANLTVDCTANAQDLIEQSAVIIGINSTTLLESLMVGRSVILPLFDEASDKYYDDHVYFKNYQDQVFEVVRDPESLETVILEKLTYQQREPHVPEQMIKDYLGFFDDQSTARTVQGMLSAITDIKNNPH